MSIYMRVFNTLPMLIKELCRAREPVWVVLNKLQKKEERIKFRSPKTHPNNHLDICNGDSCILAFSYEPWTGAPLPLCLRCWEELWRSLHLHLFNMCSSMEGCFLVFHTKFYHGSFFLFLGHELAACVICNAISHVRTINQFMAK